MGVEHIQREPTPEEQFGRMVRTVREGRGWSQEVLARRLKEDAGVVIDQSGIARIESGKRAVRLNEVMVLSRVLGLDLSAFMTQPHAHELAQAEIELAQLDIQVQEVRTAAINHEAALAAARDQLAFLLARQAHIQSQVVRIASAREREAHRLWQGANGER